MVWVLKDGAAGPSLARLQFGIELAILLWGLRVWLRCTTKWRSSLRRVNAVVQVYFLIYIADAVCIVNNLLVVVFGLVHGRLEDNHACSASAFVAMSLAYTRSSAYLIATVVSLLYLSGYQQTRCLRVYAMLSCGLGWLAGIAVSTGFAAEHRFGNYKNIYCMVPPERYSGWGFTMGFLFVGFHVCAALAINLLGYRTASSLAPLSPLSSSSFSGSASSFLVNGLLSRTNSFRSSTATGNAPMTRTQLVTQRVRAFRVIFKADMTMLSIFLLAHGPVLLVNSLIFSGRTVPLGLDVLAGVLYKTQPLLDSLYINLVLRKIDQRTRANKVTARGNKRAADTAASRATDGPGRRSMRGRLRRAWSELVKHVLGNARVSAADLHETADFDDREQEARTVQEGTDVEQAGGQTDGQKPGEGGKKKAGNGPTAVMADEGDEDEEEGVKVKPPRSPATAEGQGTTGGSTKTVDGLTLSEWRTLIVICCLRCVFGEDAASIEEPETTEERITKTFRAKAVMKGKKARKVPYLNPEFSIIEEETRSQMSSRAETGNLSFNNPQQHHSFTGSHPQALASGTGGGGGFGRPHLFLPRLEEPFEDSVPPQQHSLRHHHEQQQQPPPQMQIQQQQQQEQQQQRMGGQAEAARADSEADGLNHTRGSSSDGGAKAGQRLINAGEGSEPHPEP